MRLPLRVIAVLAAGFLAGCADSSTGPVALNPRLSATSLWSGGELLIHDQGFAAPSALPTVLLGADNVLVRRYDDTTVSVQLPRTTGTFGVEVIRGRDTVAVGDVRLYGFRDERQGPYMSGKPHWIDRETGGPPLVLAHGDSGAVIVDLRTFAAISTIPDSISSPDCLFSPGATYQPHVFVMRGMLAGGCGMAKTWQILPALQLVDTTYPGPSTNWAILVQPGPQRWFMARNGDGYLFGPNVHNQLIGIPSGAPQEMIMSPARDLFLWTPDKISASREASAVFDVATMDTAYKFSGFGGMLGAVFTAGGDTMFLHEADTGWVPNTHLRAVRSNDGAVLQSLELDSIGINIISSAGSLALDPVHPWLYLAFVTRDSAAAHPGLLVVDRNTLKPLGVLKVQQASVAGSQMLDGAFTVIPSPAENVVYIITTSIGVSAHKQPGILLRFDTPP